MTCAVEVVQLPHGEGLPLPRYETAGAAGLDLRAAVAEAAPLTIAPGERALVPTGLALALPPGLEAQVRPRSGLALRHGVTVLNAPGTIDSDYRGEICVILANHGREPFHVARGMRVAQLVVARVEVITLELTGSLPASRREAGGFGSTGIDDSEGHS